MTLTKFQKGTGLAKVNPTVRAVDSRVEKARQRFNERLRRAEAEYYEDLRRALSVAEPASADTAPQSPPPEEEPIAAAG